jgi:hypothetical protein
MFRGFGAAMAALFLFTSVVLAQNRSDLSINAFGSFVTQSSGQQVTLAPTTSTGFLATYRHALKQRHAVELNYAFTRNSQNYTVTDLSGNQTLNSIRSNVHEATADYVFTPRKSARLNPFLFAGGGALIFSPVSNSATPLRERPRKPKEVFCMGAARITDCYTTSLCVCSTADFFIRRLTSTSSVIRPDRGNTPRNLQQGWCIASNVSITTE